MSNLHLENNAILTHYYHNQNSEWGFHYQKLVDLHISNKLIVDCPFIASKFPPIETPQFTFIDLFAGIGGFRIALQSIGGKCIFSSEWDKEAKKTYYANFGEEPFGDITKEEIKACIPKKFDVLCAGFPCQPFSKGGARSGFEDTRGTLFFDICEILEKYKPKFVFLENVANLVTHDNKNTYKVIIEKLTDLGYYFPKKPLVLSPDKFGIPVLRPRIYIPCVRKDIAEKNQDFILNFDKEIEKYFTNNINPIDSVLDKNIEDKISDYEMKVLKLWDSFYQIIDIKTIGFPIWFDYFKYQGDYTEFPIWKAKFVKKNVELYQRNQFLIDQWIKDNDNLDWVINTHRKLEWQCGVYHKSIFEGLIQFRPSGVRVKKADKFSTLVAMNHQQIIGKLGRKISIEESKLLQSFPKDYILSDKPSIALKQLGNSVNVEVVKIIFSLIKEEYYDKG